MKLLKSLFIGAAIAQDPKSGSTCDLSTLNLVDMTNFNNWYCTDGTSSDNKPKKTKCFPVCKTGYQELCSKCFSILSVKSFQNFKLILRRCQFFEMRY